MAKFGCKLAALRLEHIANDDPRSFCGEQASLGCALSACASTDKYDFPFEAIHFLSSICLKNVGTFRGTYRYVRRPAISRGVAGNGPWRHRVDRSLSDRLAHCHPRSSGGPER